ncbi:MAG: hypothetical protein WCC84_10330 [Candidatus Cybelea sp.]
MNRRLKRRGVGVVAPRCEAGHTAGSAKLAERPTTSSDRQEFGRDPRGF